ncbi:MAG TPA: methylated-DNA--[protein]-cysteine S-methyltransferase, partial [Alphaproteobacteria bacterium]|nr:methylated-DNA--[protein]-cysteine S-methyltransferase [Alphaproteobacteria bacterium]
FDAQLAGRSHMDVSIVDTLSPEEAEYGSVDTPFGKMTLVWCEEGLMYLGFREGRSLEKIRHFFPDVRLSENPREAARLAKRVEDIWRGRSKDKLTLVVTGTEFQKDVWRALLKIPCGHVVSYGAIASALGRDRAVRAVGSAVGANPISLLIPCHRVIQKNGSVCNYGWGDTVKQKILKMEVEAAA